MFSRTVRPLALFFAVFIPLAPGAAYAATFTNDFEIVEFDPNDQTNSSSDSAQSVPVGSNSAVFQNSTLPNTSNTTQTDTNTQTVTFTDTTPTDSTTSATPVVETVTVGSSPGTSSSGNTTPADSTAQTVESASVYSTLLGNQAVVVSSGSGGGGGGGFFGFGNIPDTIRISAEKVRDSLAVRDIRSINIRNRDALLDKNSGARFAGTDFAIFVSSAILADQNVADVDFTNGTVTTRYRALGRLFSFVPIRYLLRVSVHISQGSVTDVTVRFPWYKFFLATGISKEQLEALLLRQINTYAAGGTDTDTDIDAATRAFSAVADVLSSRFGI